MTHIPYRFVPALGLMAALLAGCQTTPKVDLAKTGGDIAVLRLAADKTPPEKEGVCWASDTAPAVIETVTEQVQVRPEIRSADGTITQAAQFQTRTKQRMVADRETIWFTSPCPSEMTVAFIASLQRALKARGWYKAPVTGAWDEVTQNALRTYQRSRGLDSPHLSLEAAQDLGIAATPL